MKSIGENRGRGGVMEESAGLDITPRKDAQAALRESEERFRAAAENMLDCLGIYTAVRDEGGRITDFRVEFVNGAACDNNRLSREEQIGRLLCDILPGHRGSELFEDYCRVVETGEPLIKQTFVYEDDYSGRRLARSFDIRAARLGDGFVALWRDVTEARRTEKALRDSEARLAETDRRKDEFLAMLAHELRNPLAAVRSATEVLRHVDVSGPQLQSMRAVIERQTDQLTRMVEDLLDISRIGQGKLTVRKTRIDLSAVVERAVETSQPLIEAGRHRLRVELPAPAPRLDGDLQRLAQAVSNLLNNAAKYTETGGNIELTVEIAGDEALLRVKDDGIGIPAEILPNVFDLFAQADRALHRAQGGLGIGLTLVKNIVEMHGGRAEAFSAGPGQGSEVVLHLPLAEEAHPGAFGLTAATAPAPPSGHRVLVVDDNVDSAESLAMLLEIAGHEVRATHDGVSAVEIARDFQPRFVLLDIGLPGMDGFEVARRLRQESEMRQAVLVALTGYGQPEDRRKSLDAGFDHHLTKPVDFVVLKKLIDALQPA